MDVLQCLWNFQVRPVQMISPISKGKKITRHHDALQGNLEKKKVACSEGFLWLYWIVNSLSHIEVSCYLLVSLICSLALYAESSRRLVFCLLLYFETKLSKIHISLFYPDLGESRSEPFIFQFAVCKVIPQGYRLQRERNSQMLSHNHSYKMNEREKKSNQETMTFRVRIWFLCMFVYC